MGMAISVRCILESGAYGIDAPALLHEHCNSSQLAVEMPSSSY